MIKVLKKDQVLSMITELKKCKMKIIEDDWGYRTQRTRKNNPSISLWFALKKRSDVYLVSHPDDLFST